MNKRMPKVGETVIFFPSESDDEARNNGAQKVPAIVVQPWSETCVNLSVIPDCLPNLLSRTSVLHKSEATEECEYWDFKE